MKGIVTSTLFPPIGACRYGCGTHCTPAITVFWLFGVVSVAYGLMGGPTNAPGVNWYILGLGLGMWAIAAVWTLLTLQGVQADKCHNSWSPQDHQVPPSESETDPFEEVRKAR